jgi:hypothetical protein
MTRELRCGSLLSGLNCSDGSAPPMPSSSTTTSRPASNVSAVIGGSLIAAGAVVPQGVVVPARSLVTGIPGRVWCELSEAEIAANRHNGEVYRRLLDIH